MEAGLFDLAIAWVQDGPRLVRVGSPSSWPGAGCVVPPRLRLDVFFAPVFAPVVLAGGSIDRGLGFVRPLVLEANRDCVWQARKAFGCKFCRIGRHRMAFVPMLG